MHVILILNHYLLKYLKFMFSKILENNLIFIVK